MSKLISDVSPPTRKSIEIFRIYLPAIIFLGVFRVVAWGNVPMFQTMGSKGVKGVRFT